MVAVARRITEVIEWQNGMVMVFDQFGDQMPEFQGRVENVKAKIKEAFDGEWKQGNWPKHRHYEEGVHKFITASPFEGLT